MNIGKIFIFITGTFIYCLLGILSAVYSPIFLIPLILIGVFIIVGLFIRFINIRKQKELNISPEIISDFNMVEKKYIENEGKVEPHQILWELSKLKNQKGGVDYNGTITTDSAFNFEQSERFRNSAERERGIKISDVYNEPIGGQNIPSNSNSGDSDDKTSDSGIKRSNPKNIFRRRK